MANMNITGSGYAEKMNNIASQALAEWWKSLSKEEILKYLSDQPQITADVLRQLIGNSNSVLSFDLRFDSASNQAVTDFHLDK